MGGAGRRGAFPSATWIAGTLCFIVAAGRASDPIPPAGGPGQGPPEQRRTSRLTIDCSHPFYLRWGDRPLLLIGASDRSALTIWRSDKGFHWLRYLEELAAHGFNYVRQDVAAWTGLGALSRHPAQFTRPRWPFARTGPGVAVDGRPRFDLTRFDEGFFRERLAPFLREADRRGIVVELTLFDDCRSRRAFVDSLYASSANVNTLGLEPGNDPHADAALANARLVSIQEGYAARVIDATREFGNVIYEVINESGGARWVAHFVEFIHRRLPGALVSAGEQGSAYDPVAGRCDIVVKHRGRAGLYRTHGDIARHRASLENLRRGGKPVLHNEFFLFANRSTDDTDFVRKMFWADLTGGGHANFYDFTWWRGTGRTVGEGDPSRSPPTEILNAARMIRRFVDEGAVPFWSLWPRDEMARRDGSDGVDPFVLARPGGACVAYLLDGGTVTVEMSEESSTLAARWFNPRTGDWKDAGNVAGSFTSPDRKDWVLLVGERTQTRRSERPEGGP